MGQISYCITDFITQNVLFYTQLKSLSTGLNSGKYGRRHIILIFLGTFKFLTHTN
ncbi:hypothetical protein GO684_01710 [Wolbachia endosymbiont of Litomosoides brasiliensis]|uniref:hypothetical protein n=1 Tax=Wolbachia endosymbiont of Litomosoides brasiliensis TaxID=1812117 RepID=UPI00158C0A1F|nr:hypothetical protein [Wolbachia endosymbiont of Litomosoides brasiliensis]NUY39417.1 hypothetical protein [Wolbachia endosymbiont of Litomosoides brasiliensis]